MASSLVRGKYVITRVIDRREAETIDDGAVYQENGRIVDIGPHAALLERYRPDEIIGNGRHVVLPGFVNSHHHVGLTPVQLGSLDQPLELWFATRLSARNVDVYLDTLYSAFEMIESGITTVQHLHGWRRDASKGLLETASRILDAYRDIGMRVSYSYAVRDQNRLVYEHDEDFLGRLPPELVPDMRRHFDAQSVPLAEQFGLFEELYRRHEGDERARIQLAPANLHWCSDDALERLRCHAEQFDVPMHMHLLETPYQKEYARRRGGGTALEYLQKLGLLGAHMTLGHGVWLTQGDVEIAAETGTRVCHNCSSNFRLRSGVAPLNVLEAHGVRVAIGIDEAGINDDRDMLQEMRLVLKAHREPGMDDRAPTSAQVLRMATEHGAHTTPFGSHIGTLEAGKAADMVLIDWHQIASPYLDEDIPVIDAVVHRAKSKGVDTVIVAGEPIYRDRRFTRVNKDDALAEIAAALSKPRSAEEQRRRKLARDVLPHVEHFYRDYLAGEVRRPFYRPSSRE